MALPPGAAAALGSDMASKGMGGGVPDAPESEPDAAHDAAAHEIAGDAVDAIKSGDKEQAAKFLVELIKHCMSEYDEDEGTEEPEE